MHVVNSYLSKVLHFKNNGSTVYSVSKTKGLKMGGKKPIFPNIMLLLITNEQENKTKQNPKSCFVLVLRGEKVSGHNQPETI